MSAPVLLDAAREVLLRIIVDGAFKNTLVFAAAALLAFALRASTAALRHSIWSSALTATLVVPVLSSFAPAWLPVIPKPGTQAFASAGGEPSWPLTLVLFCWAAGMLVTVVWLAAGRGSLWLYARRAHLDREPRVLAMLAEARRVVGTRGRVLLLRASDETMPITWGVFRARILLPPSCASWSDELLRTVLRHELVHVRRRDVMTQAIAQLACALCWFNPVVWVMARRLRDERELACDEATVALGTPPVDYADRLFELALIFRARSRAPLAGLGVAGQSTLKRRIGALLSLSSMAPNAGASLAAQRAAVLGAMVALVVLLAGSRSANREEPSGPAGGRENARVVTTDRLPGSGPASFRSDAAPRLRALLGR